MWIHKKKLLSNALWVCSTISNGIFIRGIGFSESYDGTMDSHVYVIQALRQLARLTRNLYMFTFTNQDIQWKHNLYILRSIIYRFLLSTTTLSTFVSSTLDAKLLQGIIELFRKLWQIKIQLRSILFKILWCRRIFRGTSTSIGFMYSKIQGKKGKMW